MEFLNILFIIILIIIALRLLMRYVLPWLLVRYFRKKQKEFMGNMQKDSEHHGKKAGEVNVDYTPEQPKKKDLDDVGEYTDFEEINGDDK